jgi:hypothetical protein
MNPSAFHFSLICCTIVGLSKAIEAFPDRISPALVEGAAGRFGSRPEGGRSGPMRHPAFWIGSMRLCLVLLVGLALPAGCGEERGEDEGKAPEAAPLSIWSRPGDGGRVRRLDRPLLVRMEGPVSPGAVSFQLSPEAGPLEAAWSRDRRQAVIRHGRPFVEGTAYTLSVVHEPDGRRAEVRFTATGPSTFARIDAAEAEGRLDANRAWELRMQGAFDRERLPEAYRSETPVPDLDGMVRDYVRVRDRLDPATARELDRYLVRPTEPESFLYYGKGERSSFLPRLGPRRAFAGDENGPSEAFRDVINFGREMVYVDCARGRLRIWAPEALAGKAVWLRDTHDRYDMWGRFEGLLGRAPVSDLTADPNGGDGRIDVYLIPQGEVYSEGICIPEVPLIGNKSSAYIYLLAALGGKELASTLAHELFHAFQYAFDKNEDHWWSEATAVWAEHYTDAAWNTEWEFIQHAFEVADPESSLLPLMLDPEVHELHDYGVYLLPLFLQQEYGEQAIRFVWENCQTQGSLDAIDRAVGFEDAFKEFALFNMDHGPFEGRYADHGGPLRLFEHHFFRDVLLLPDDEELVGGEKQVSLSVPRLGALYLCFYNGLDTETTPSLTFDLRQFQNNPDLAVQAVIDPEGKALQEDWTGREERTFCLNRDSETFTDLAIVVTNKTRPPKPGIHLDEVELIVEADAGGCSEKHGRVTVTRSVVHKRNTHREHQWRSGDKETRTVDEHQEVRARVRFTVALADRDVEQGLRTVTETYDLSNASIQSLSVQGQSVTTETHYDESRDCSYETVLTQRPASATRRRLEHGDGFSVTYDLETGRAKWVTLPAFQLLYDLREQIESQTRGCSDRGDTSKTLTRPHQIFTLGPVNVPSRKELAQQARPELGQMQQIARQMQQLARNPLGADEQEMAEMTEALARSFAEKIVSPDLRVTGGDGTHSLQGGGTRTIPRKLEHGSESTSHTFKWRVELQEEDSGR